MFLWSQWILIMLRQDALSGLIGSANALEWAHDNLTHLKSGTAASIFAHPADPSLVVRVSDYPDGWFLFADETVRMAAEGRDVELFRPRVDWIGEVNGIFVALTERLETIDDDCELTDTVRSVCRALGGDNAEWRLVERSTPGFMDFCSSLGPSLDLREDNFLRRGETLVFNDPYSAIPFAAEQALRDIYRVEPAVIFGSPAIPQY
jgi:hypothetical protein